MRILYCAIRSDRPRHDRGIGPRDGGGGRACGARATRCTCWSTPGGAFPDGPCQRGSRCRRRSGARSCAGRTPARSARIARALRPDVIIERYYNFGGEGIAAAGRRRRDRGARGECAGHRLSRDRPSACIDRALLVEPMRRWRERICATGRSDRHAERGHPAAGDAARERSSSSSGARTPSGFSPAPAGRSRSHGPPAPSPSSPARSAAGTAPCISRAPFASCGPAGAHDIGAVFIGDGPELSACARGGRGARGRGLHRRRCRTRRCPRVLRRATSASRRSTSARTAPSRSASTGRR